MSSRTLPERFRLPGSGRSRHDRLLTEINALFERPSDPEWTFTEAGLDVDREKQARSRLALSNGFLGIRGDIAAADEEPAFIAGRFRHDQTEPDVPTLAPGPSPFSLAIAIDGLPLESGSGETVDYGRTLDMRRGILRTFWRQRQASGQIVEVEALRFVSLAHRSLAAQAVRLRLERPSRVSIDAPSARPTLQAEEGVPHHLAYGRNARLWVDGIRFSGDRAETLAEREVVAVQVATYRLADRDGNALAAASADLTIARSRGFAELALRHEEAWEARWQASEVSIDGDEAAQKALRFAVYHLNSAADPTTEQVSVGARGLTGRSYLGHVFWDTEIFMLPFYSLSWPAAARAMLGYRYRTLDAARRKAHTLGYAGALFAWESADTGEEATPKFVVGPKNDVILISSGKSEHHISADVAFAAWQFWQATGDREFLLRQGVDLIIETARFWASRVEPDGIGGYHLRHVVGPDEYHDDVDDNAFTNGLARWNLLCAARLVRLLVANPGEWRPIQARLGLQESEPPDWEAIAGALVLPTDDRGVIEQFEGYFDLRQVDLAPFGRRHKPMDMVLTPDFVRRSQIIKQADVLMLTALVEDFSEEQQKLNFVYYEKRCGHGSSLSAPVHALMAARTGEPELGLYYFRQTAAIDLQDSFANGSGGLHMAALAGLWQSLAFGFAGMRVEEDGLGFRPHMPKEWQRLTFRTEWRGSKVEIEVSSLSLTVRVLEGKPLLVWLRDRLALATPDQPAVLFERPVPDRGSRILDDGLQTPGAVV